MSKSWVTAHTDGAASMDGTVGGWAYILAYNGHKLIRGDRVLDRKNETLTGNRMEIIAAIEALKAIKDGSRVTIYSDSQYLVFTMTRGHKRNKNGDLWHELDEQWIRMAEVQWNWIPREMNEEADRASKAALSGKHVEVRIPQRRRELPVRKTIYHPDLAKKASG